MGVQSLEHRESGLFGLRADGQLGSGGHEFIAVVDLGLELFDGVCVVVVVGSELDLPMEVRG